MTYQSIFGLSLFLLIAACGNPQSEDANNEAENTEQTTDADGSDAGQPTEAEAEKENKAYQKMIDAHDVVMPRMSEIAEAQLQLREVLEQTNPNDRFHTKASTMIDDLESIHDDMMEWMSSAMVSPDDLRKSKNHREIMAHYDEYDGKMADMDSELNAYLSTTQELVGMVVGQ